MNTDNNYNNNSNKDRGQIRSLEERGFQLKKM